MSESNENLELVKCGYLDVKYPPGSQGRKFGKAWHRRWVVALAEKSKDPVICLKLFANETRNDGVICNYQFQRPALLFRSCSNSRPRRAFGVAISGTKCSRNLKVLLYMAADDERHAELWMKILRDVIMPPPPLVQTEDVLREGHYVSLIDNEQSFLLGLLGSYGYMLVECNSLIILHPHTGQAVAQWPLDHLKDVKTIRFDYENSPSGVFAVYLRTQKENENSVQCLSFYSPTARTAAKDFSEVLRSGDIRRSGDVRRQQSFSAKCEKGLSPMLQNLSAVAPTKTELRNEKCNFSHLSKQKEGKDIHRGPKFSDSENSRYNESTKSETTPLNLSFEKFSCTSSDILNSSITSFLHSENGCCSNSESGCSDESEYTPPRSPKLTRRETFTLGRDINSRETTFVLENEYVNLPHMEKPKCTEKKETSGRSSDIRWSDCGEKTNFESNYLQSGSAKTEDTNCTYYANDNLQYDDDGLNTEHIYADIPSYEGCRSTSLGGETLYEELEMDEKVSEETHAPPLPPPRQARRPTALRLEQLSSNIERTLLNLHYSATVSRPSQKSKSWFNPIKGMKKILGKDRKTKSANPSPTEESSPKHERKQTSVKRVDSEPVFFEMPEGIDYMGKCSPVESWHSLTTSELPIPFLPLNWMKEEKTQCPSQFLPDREQNGIPNNVSTSRSLDDLQLGLESKHSCLKHLLDSLKTGEKEIICKCRDDLWNAQSLNAYHFHRRQSKSLSIDIEKHFHTLQTLSPFETKGITDSSRKLVLNEDLPEYCAMTCPATESCTAGLVKNIGGGSMDYLDMKSISD